MIGLDRASIWVLVDAHIELIRHRNKKKVPSYLRQKSVRRYTELLHRKGKYK